MVTVTHLGLLLAFVLVFQLIEVSSSKTAPPINAVYIDAYLGGQNIRDVMEDCANWGYNHLILAFYLYDRGALDAALLWQRLGPIGITALKDKLLAINPEIKILISVGGATENGGKSVTSLPAAAYAEQAVQWACNNQMDGLDYDLENFLLGSFAAPAGPITLSDQNWLFTLQRTTYQRMAATNCTLYPISHAPQAPYMDSYLRVVQSVHETAPIHHLFVQYYNQGESSFETYCDLMRHDRHHHGGSQHRNEMLSRSNECPSPLILMNAPPPPLPFPL
jgi:chitinase